MKSAKNDNKWLHAEPTITKDAWTVMIHGGEAGDNGEPDTASLFWPKGRPLMIPSKMVLMTVETFRELNRLAGHGVGTEE